MQSLTSSSHDLVTLISQETGSLLKTEAVVSEIYSYSWHMIICCLFRLFITHYESCRINALINALKN